MTHEEYIKRRDEMLDRNEDGWLSRKDLEEGIDEFVNLTRIDTIQIVDSLLSQEHVPLHIVQADVLKRYIHDLGIPSQRNGDER